MKKALVLAAVWCLFGNQVFAGGMIGGIPPSVAVDATEFARIAHDAIRGIDVMIDDELMQPETMNFKERTIMMRSRVEPSKTVQVKVNPDKD